MAAIHAGPEPIPADTSLAIEHPSVTRRTAASDRGLLRGAFRIVRIAALVAAGLVLVRGLDVIGGNNWSSIVAPEAYRSGQLTGPELGRLIREVGLKSVVNLRGANPTPWYRDETAVCEAAGVRHYDLAMSARELPEPEVVLQLLALLRQAPRPVLIHCKNGADRAGLAAALYLIQEEGVAVNEGLAAGLSAWRGHLPIAATDELERFLHLYRTHGSGKDLERWTREDYPRIFLHEWRPASPLVSRIPGLRKPLTHGDRDA